MSVNGNICESNRNCGCHDHEHDEHSHHCEHKHEHHHEHEHKHEHEHHHDHGHCHCHGHEPGHCSCSACEQEHSAKELLIRLCIGAAAIIGALLTKGAVSVMLYGCAVAAFGYNVIWNGIKNIIKHKSLDELFLMSIASLGAFALGEYFESAMVMLLYQAGEYLQDKATDRARDSVRSLASRRSDTAEKLTENGYVTLDAHDVHPGDEIRITAGSRVPLDCRITSGGCFADTSSITGEYTPRRAEAGDTLYSGYINTDGLVTAVVTAELEDSAEARIQRLVEECSDKKSHSERFITRFAKVYTPAVCIAAVLTALLPILFGGRPGTWIYRALIFLVVSCPCALVISVPLAFYAGLGRCAREHILIKGALFLERLAKIKTIVFDKTGTLTTGTFEVTDIIGGDDVLKLAAYAEHFSDHPIAKSIRSAYTDDIEEDLITEFTEISGKGVHINLDGKNIAVGNAALMKADGIAYTPAEANGKTTVYVACDGEIRGTVTISDRLKSSGADTVNKLKRSGIKTVILSGDSTTCAQAVGSTLGVDEVYAELLPQDKAVRLEKIMKAGGITAFAGDGINDAPSLSLADVGIAMGERGADSAVQAADVVIMNDDPADICKGIQLSKRTMTVVYENIILSVGVKLIAMILGALGITGMWFAMFADVGVALLAVLNCMRLTVSKHTEHRK